MDHDSVEVINLAAQGYLPEDLGTPKVEATAQWCRRIHPDLSLHLYAERFRRSSTHDLRCFRQTDRRLAVFCCVDSISGRRIVWETVRSHAAFFADARMSAEVIRVLASDRPSLEAHYSSTLFAQDEAYGGSCTARSTIYTANLAAGLMLCQFARYLRGVPVERDLLLNLLASELSIS